MDIFQAGQYLGITADNSANLPASNLQYGNGSLLKEDGHVDFQAARYYHRLYGEAWIDLCERSLVRMKQKTTTTTEQPKSGVGSLIGISSPGCNVTQFVNKGYSMPGTGECVVHQRRRGQR